MGIRLNKLLAERGIASRRHCDVLIAEGRVRVNGRVVTELGTVVEEARDRVEVNGKPIPGRQRHVYYVLNKPVGVITTMDDPQGRKTVRSLLPRGARVYPVGRLDADTSGLLLLTNDGELAHKLMHPRYGVVKVYRVRLEREPSRSQLERLSRGVRYEPGVTSAPALARRIDPGFDAIMIELQIHEGRFRQVRRMCEAVGLVVTGLHRVGYGPLRLGPLARGMFRELSEDEIARLRAAAARPAREHNRSRGQAEGVRDARRERNRNAGAERPQARPSRPAGRRPVPPATLDAEAADAEREETWIPGGGYSRDFEAEGETQTPAWPARPDTRRGDADYRGPQPERPRGEGRRPRGERGERPRRPEGRGGERARADRPAQPRRTGGSPRSSESRRRRPGPNPRGRTDRRRGR
jgi:23S rRNA pseudouridine2605 synthase